MSELHRTGLGFSWGDIFGGWGDDYSDYADYSYDPWTSFLPGTGAGDSDGGSGFWDSFYYYLSLGYDQFEAELLAQQYPGIANLPAGYEGPWWDPSWVPPPNWYPWPVTGPNIQELPTPPAPLPGACPTGQYHPYPIGHPQQNACATLSNDPTQRQRQQQQEQQRAGRRPGTLTSSLPQQCSGGQWMNPRTRRCEAIPRCAANKVFSPQAGQCVSTAEAARLAQRQQGQGQGLTDLLAKMPFSMWLVLFIALGGLLVSGWSGGSSSGRKPRTRK